MLLIQINDILYYMKSKNAKSPSPTPKSPKKSSSPSKNSLDPHKNYKCENRILLGIRNRFEKDVADALNKIGEFSLSQAASRCLLHKNIVTLYCEFQRQPLCANCMYESQTHRSHRVIPVQKAENLIKQDIKAFHNKLSSVIKQLQKQSNDIKKKTIEMDMFYDSSILDLKKFYRDLREMIEKKQEEQIAELSDIKEKINLQNTYICKEIQSMISIITENMKKYSNKSYESKLITRRSVLEVLTRSKKMLNQMKKIDLSCSDISKIDFDTFHATFSTINSKLKLTVPIMGQKKKISRTGFHYDRDGLSQSPSMGRLSRSKASQIQISRIQRQKSQKTLQDQSKKKVRFKLWKSTS